MLSGPTIRQRGIKTGISFSHQTSTGQAVNRVYIECTVHCTVCVHCIEAMC